MREKKIDTVIAIMAIGMVAYLLVNVHFYMLGSIQHKMLFLALSLVLVFLAASKTSDRPWYPILLILASLGAIGYLALNLERLLRDIAFPLPVDLIVGFVIMAVVFWACNLSFGIILPIVAVSIILYAFLGRYLGGPILSADEIVTSCSLTFGGYDMFGAVLGVAANVIILFVVYAGLLRRLRATDFFVEAGRIIGRYSRSGPAMTAVVSSAAMATTCGQTTPNIAVTGAFTIPLMKRVGYKPEVAGAIEAAASGAGQITPPIMGTGAFVMAELLEVPYTTVIIMAAIPAMLYFSSLGLFVHLHALKAKVMPLEEKVDMRRLLATAPLFIIPLGVILFLLFVGYPPMFAAFWGIASILMVAFMRKETRPSLGGIIDGFILGATMGARVGVACATIGPVIALMTKTGLGLKIGFSVELLSGGNLLIGLMILMVAIIILGLELPTVGAYLIAAVVAIPALVRLGLEPRQAHMFAFFFAAFSSLTPPVGMSAFVASKLAGATYLRTAFHAINAAAAAYLIPFVFVFNGSLLLLPGTNPASVLITITLVLLGLFIFQVGFVGFFLTHLNLWERLLAVLSGLALIVFAAVGIYPLPLISATLLFVIIFRQLRKRARIVRDNG